MKHDLFALKIEKANANQRKEDWKFTTTIRTSVQEEAVCQPTRTTLVLLCLQCTVYLLALFFTFFLLLIFYFSSNNNTIGTFSFLIIFIHCLAAPLWLWCISVISFSLFFALYSKYMCDWINRLAVFRVSQKTWFFIAVFILFLKIFLLWKICCCY